MNKHPSAALVARQLEMRRAELGLGDAPIEVTYVLNAGGFMTANFHVRSGDKAVHVKVASGKYADKLQNWMSTGGLLSERYRAPAILGSLSFLEYRAIVLEHLEGRTFPGGLPEPVVEQIVSLARSLHADEDAREALGPARPLRGSFLDYYIHVLEADLREFPTSPPFVDAETNAWMRAETAALRAACERSSAFDGEVHAAIHGDLWPGNVLVSDDGRWWLIDWDEVTIGDPVLDHALLVYDVLDEEAIRRTFAEEDDAFHERLRLCLRATNMIGVVDSLADWYEAAGAPVNVEQVRAQKEADHRYALQRYRDLYG